MTVENSTGSTVSGSDGQVDNWTLVQLKIWGYSGRNSLIRKIMFIKMDDATVQAKVGEMVREAEQRITRDVADQLGSQRRASYTAQTLGDLSKRFNYDVSVEDYYENCSYAKVSIRGLKDSQVQYLLDLVEQMREEAKSVTQESVA